MPKVSSTSRNSPSPPQSLHTLRRNQACHQCRRRKLVSRSRSPSSHPTYLPASSPPFRNGPPLPFGPCPIPEHTNPAILPTATQNALVPPVSALIHTELPALPQCTYDEVEAGSVDSPENPNTRFERLENRINELETLLREKDRIQSFHKQFATDVTNPLRDPLAQALSINSPFQPDVGNSLSFPNQFPENTLDNLADIASLVGTVSTSIEPDSRVGSTSSPLLNDAVPTAMINGMDPATGISYNAWPRNLPQFPLLRHLVDTFFVCYPHAVKLFHHSTFMASLTLPPTHPKFPAASVLHAICAVGSMYTSVLPRPTNPQSAAFSPSDEIFPDKYKLAEGIPDSFSEIQAKHAKAASESAIDVGRELFQNVQALTVLAWWYWCNAKWADAFLCTSHALRYALPCGLNVCPPFHSIAETVRPTSLLAPATDVIEDEASVAYAIERTHGVGNNWAMTLDDQDVSQLLPLRRDQFEQGILVVPQERQWSHDNNVLLVHPDDQTDSFILYIKGTMLLSKVKNFNLRFRHRIHTGDASTIGLGPSSLAGILRPKDYVDFRETPAFMEIDQLVALFKTSFPNSCKNPLEDHVDALLYAACLSAQLADILLHEPHAIVGRDSCRSSCRILQAARAILELLYSICATSYDLQLLGLFPVMCWFMAGRVLVRFLRAAIDSNSEEMTTAVRSEVDFILMVLFRVGEHVPLAHRYARMLFDFIGQICGESYAMQVSSVPSPQQGYVSSSDTNGFANIRPAGVA
ncbi:uncharacterized protein FIBRA_01582 [Fibroporia radiculosa]|uniref:Transcription factor domain-containing protein n=1 Tax=Fibroporia radiculosa TaxID=599839 RepID=J4H1A6_9APHY|nr:uncharacterized protein FIBRA_01582 [Fibroporia radiculosa]CCL99564.1 predicted protein [Fibroporia radiculosa]